MSEPWAPAPATPESPRPTFNQDAFWGEFKWDLSQGEGNALSGIQLSDLLTDVLKRDIEINEALR